MAMQMLFMHWKAIRFGMIPFVIAAFAIPLLLLQELGGPLEYSYAQTASLALYAQQNWVAFLPVLAGSVGVVLGLSAWHWDHKLNHIYSLSLPVSRARYALMKFGAGVIIALVPTTALLAGSFVAVNAYPIPTGLQGYPIQLAGHFLFATLVIYSLIFSMASGTVRTTVILGCLLVGVPIVSSIGLQYLAAVDPSFRSFDLGYWLQRSLDDFGPFRILMGNWKLIDV
jgi:hypothetical protein